MIFILFLIYLNISSVSSRAIQITTNNIESTLSSNEFVLINFYANWCRFSQILDPIYDQLADKVNELYSKNNSILIGKVDCDQQSSIGQKYHIDKYPTIKYFRHGILIKKEYRGSRTLESLLNFIQQQIQSPIVNLNQIENKYSYIVGHFNNTNSKSYQIFSKIAKLLQDDCHFAQSFSENDHVYYQPSQFSHEINESFHGNLENENEFYSWSHNKCIELVREITFENAEELTDQGLPFLILFHHPNDTQSVSLFKQQVEKQLKHETQSINCLHANGLKFTHPLKHLNKDLSDLPLLVIDTFRHMFLFPHFNLISINGKLVEFVRDLHSGKLHRDFHEKSTNLHENVDTGENSDMKLSKTNFPPESIFVRLTPSRQRYSFRDEL
ncbi:unnamed protein product [Adineta ricciae]|uniref:Thioredoxin domain-containing protein n=1 Tax=Adineta ricciae TaxID=249248 RepID=A0A814JSH2_ADIRI|nr:unnamed protein product [Adineta ricciae]CAF1526553.1 unnamed protein product [Adineta ricciae]